MLRKRVRGVWVYNELPFCGDIYDSRGEKETEEWVYEWSRRAVHSRNPKTV